jgi:hypothetical protein
MSLKRRRAINIDTAMIDELRMAAEARGLKSHTTLAVAILLGEQPPIPPVEKRAKKTLGVSMRESTWLSVRHRAEMTTTPAPHLMSWMLTGEAPPLTPEEISKGVEAAAKREAERAKGAQDPNPKRKTEPSPRAEEKAAPNPAPVKIDYEKEDEEERKARQAKLPKGSPLDPPQKPKQKELESSDLEEEGLGGVYSL